MNDEIESRSVRRRILLMVMASAFLVWQIPGMDFLGEISAENPRASQWAAIAGFLVWAAALVFLLYSGRVATRTKNAAVAAALEDELVRANRSRAFIIGYFAALAIATIVFTMSLFLPITGRDAAQLILVGAVVIPMYAFAILERVNA
jgi:hypothetical protein